jgi:O-antigen ligase
MSKIIDRLFFTLYSLLFFITPLIMFDKTSELFEFNKMLFIYFITISILALWIFKSIIYKRLFFRKTYFDIPIFLFLISQIISTYYSIDQHTSIFGYYGRFNGGLLSTITYVILYYGFVSNIHINKQTIDRILKVNILSSFVVALWAIPDKFGYDLTCYIFTKSIKLDCWTDQFRPAERAFSTLGQPNWLGAYLCVNLFIAIYFLLKGKMSFWRTPSWRGTIESLFLLIYILLNLYVIYFTKSRTSIVAVVISLVLLLIIYIFNKIKNPIQKIGFIFITIILPLVVSMIFFFNSLSDLKVTNSNVTDSLEIRKIVWNGAVGLVKKYPLFGTGVETFAYAYNFTRPAIHNLTSEWDYVYNKAHNEYLNYLANTGFVGFFTYLFLVLVFYFYVFKKIFERKNILFNSLFLGAFTTILVNNFTGFSITIINVLFFLIMAIVFIVNEDIEHEVLPKPTYMIGLAYLIPIVILLAGGNYVISYLLADIYYAAGDNSSRQSNYPQAAIELNKALGFRDDEHLYKDKLSNVYASLALTEASSASVEAINDLFQKSVDLNKDALTASPLNTAYWKTRAKNYYYFYQLNQDDELFNTATQSLKLAAELAPTDPKILQTEALFYSLRADVEKDVTKKNSMLGQAIKLLGQSLKLKPNYEEAIVLKAEILKKME